MINRTILFGDEAFVANDRVTSNLNWRQFSLYLRLLSVPQRLCRGGAGSWPPLRRSGCPWGGRRQTAAPGSVRIGRVPTIPVDITWRIWHGLALSARGQYFHASVNNFEGSIADYHGDLQYAGEVSELLAGRRLHDHAFVARCRRHQLSGRLPPECPGPRSVLQSQFLSVSF